MRKLRKNRLVEDISSHYFEAAAALRWSSPVMVYVEGYDDIAFWRSIFDSFEPSFSQRRFEISTPARDDMAKGKKVVLSFASRAGSSLLLCVDSDFDYLFGNHTEQSRLVNSSRYVIQTYLYAIENLLCLPSSLASLATVATRNDMQIFDFMEFCEGYSRAVYPLFLWYFYAAYNSRPQILTLSEFRNCVKLNYLEIEDSGSSTVGFIGRQVTKKVRSLRDSYPLLVAEVDKMGEYLASKGVNQGEIFLYVQGHFWQDNVVRVMLDCVTRAMRQFAISRIEHSSQRPITRRNEISSYGNTLRDVDFVIETNTHYRNTSYYERIAADIAAALHQIPVEQDNQSRVPLEHKG